MVTLCCICSVSKDIPSRRKFRCPGCLNNFQENPKEMLLCPFPFLYFLTSSPGRIYLSLLGCQGWFHSGLVMGTPLPEPSASRFYPRLFPEPASLFFGPMHHCWVLCNLSLASTPSASLEPFLFPYSSICLLNFTPAPTNLSLPAAPPIWEQSSPSYISIKKCPHSVHTSDLVLYNSLSHWKLNISIIPPTPAHMGSPSPFNLPIILEKGRILLQWLVWYLWIVSWKSDFLFKEKNYCSGFQKPISSSFLCVLKC